ncbi:energy transducer TonB [Sphingomonas sp. NSE70-1]|uniref:Energy transducer TonB n=1 Tax=Sphingomonas caseinilyticus TaxID=2908205 RepID=A0ABT0RRG3_9SPHN|nr:energy transducer TonB [Sphingomonas caseinilyticus]MCL6697597.1 energy transducer TonB [Sphingomonas caseinilyticus]
MLQGLLLIAAMTVVAPAESSVQSKNGEFIFSQYPPRALAAGEQGSVRFRAEVDDKGNAMSCRITESSGHERLDRETCDLIVGHARFKPVLDGDGKSRHAVHEGYVNWRIPGVAPAPAKIAGKAPDEVVCKRITKTGSLISRSRLCLTRQEWARYAEQNQDRYGEIQGKFGNTYPAEPELGTLPPINPPN